MRLRPFVAAAALAGALAAGAPSPAAGAAYTPQPGRIFLGVTGGLGRSDYTGWVSAAGHHAPVWQLFLTWDQDRGENPYQYLRTRLALARTLDTRLGISLTTARGDGSERITPAGIASGAGDPYLLGLNRELGAAGQSVYVRPYAEMNQANNVYSAYGHRGRRGPAHSTAAFRRAWKRTFLVLRGGDVATMNRRLARLGMPAVRTSHASLPATQTAFVWCPQVAGDPNVAGNSPQAYWPGAAWVDWVGTDFYSGFPNWSGLERFYRAFDRHPFAFGEFGIYRSADAPGFVSRVLSWARSHRRVRMLLWMQGNEPGSAFRLQHNPRSAAVLRAALDSPVFQLRP
jgi:hypothetical protein